MAKDSRERLFEHIYAQLQFWLHEERKPSTFEKMDGLVFSILCIIDGNVGSHPPCELRPVDENEKPSADLADPSESSLHQAWCDWMKK